MVLKFLCFYKMLCCSIFASCSFKYVVHLWFLHFEVKLWPLINIGSWDISYPCCHHVSQLTSSTCWGQGIDCPSPSFSHFVVIDSITNETSAAVLSFGCGFGLDAVSYNFSCYAVDFIGHYSCVTMERFFNCCSSRQLRTFGLLRSRPREKLLRSEPCLLSWQTNGGFGFRKILIQTTTVFNYDRRSKS